MISSVGNYNIYPYGYENRLSPCYNQGLPPQENTSKTLVTAISLQFIAVALQKASEWCGKNLMKGKEFTSAENVKRIANQMIAKNKLNVRTDFIDFNNINNYPISMRRSLEAVAKGQNAFYSNDIKLAVAPKSRPSLILHELGHAINSSKGKLLRFLQKSRGWAPAVPTVLLLLNDSTKRVDGKKNFIERNAGLIGFSAFLPTIAEEGLASLRGIKAAKRVLGKNINISALKRNYFFALMTYVIAGISLGIAAKQNIVLSKRT